jgi:ribosomal-protein-alanine N-acetyltransferase
VARSGEILATEQLLLRAPKPADEEAYLSLFLRPEVEAWLRPAPLVPFAAAELTRMLAEDVEHWRDTGFGPWALIERESGAYVGRAGLRWTAVEGAAAVELAWTVDPAHQGRGLATEAARAGLELAREERIEEVVALVLPRNLASRRVAEKLGMVGRETALHAGLPHLVYRLTLA